MEDRSLDDFLDDTEGGATDEPETEDDESEAALAEPETGSGPAVDPAATTYAWDPEGGACETCGATVERRWSAVDGLVCSDCKEW